MRRKQRHRHYSPKPLYLPRLFVSQILSLIQAIKKLLKDKDRDKKDEHGGIGTPATRASILETLKKRNYITLEKGNLSTDTGYALIDALPDIAVNPDMTALWAEKQTLIENGEMTIEQFVDELYNDSIPMISNANSAEIRVSPARRLVSHNACPLLALPVVNRLLSGQKAIPVQDVNLKSGMSFLARKSPRHRPKNLLNQEKPI